MRHGRWYPSQVELADGRIAIIAGWDEGGLRADNRELEIYDWRDGSITHMPAGDAVPSVFSSFPYYPHLFTMPGGDVLIGGPDRVQSGLLRTGALGDAEPGSAWTPIRGALDGLGGLNQYYRGFANGVILPGFPTRAAIIGGYVGYPVVRAVRDADVIDTAATTPRWSSTSPLVPPLDVARSNGNVVILPDGTLVAVGGGAGFQSGTAGDPAGANNSYTGGDQALKRVELLRPGVDAAWRLRARAGEMADLSLDGGPAPGRPRAVRRRRLLGRRRPARPLGGDRRPPSTRPSSTRRRTCSTATARRRDRWSGRHRRRSTTATASGSPSAARDAARAVLVAPAATTHGADMNQRHVELAVTGRVDGKGINVRAPADGTLAPPGYYMLFVIDAAGTPSVARWVRLGADAPDAPELAPDARSGAHDRRRPDPDPLTAAPPAPPRPAPDTRAPRLRLSWLPAPRTRAPCGSPARRRAARGHGRRVRVREAHRLRRARRRCARAAAPTARDPAPARGRRSACVPGGRRGLRGSGLVAVDAAGNRTAAVARSRSPPLERGGRPTRIRGSMRTIARSAIRLSATISTAAQIEIAWIIGMSMTLSAPPTFWPRARRR